MAYRLTTAAEDQIDEILLESARNHGLDAAGRYEALILAGVAGLGDEPDLPGFVEVPRLKGVRAYPARLTRLRIEPSRRVAAPRHLVVYRLASDGIIEILGFAHDRMVLSRAARSLVRLATKTHTP